jgi:tRNA dimethylallyltransferase
MVETPARGGSDRGLGAEGDTDAGGTQHRHVVGAVADGDGLCRWNAAFGGECHQGLALGLSGYDRRQHPAGDKAANNLQPIGDDTVEAQFGRNPLGEDREPAADERGRGAVAAHCRDQFARSRHQTNPSRGLVEDAGLDPGQQRGASLERSDKVDLRIHRLAGDLGDMRANAEDHCQFVEHFVFDNRRLEIGDEQPLAPLRRRLDQDIDRGDGDDGAHGFDDRRRIQRIENEIAGLVRRKPDGLGFDRQRFGDRRSEAGKTEAGSAGDQGEDDAHMRSSYALKRMNNKRLAADHALAPAVIVIAGPTASGKSALASALAEAFTGTVINADSLQCYRDLKILSARPDAADCARVPHRLYGFLDAAERGSVGSWRVRALTEVTTAAKDGRLPIIVGGTGLYLRALTQGLATFPEIPEAVRQKALMLHRTLGGAAFRGHLAGLDADSARRLQAGDTQRLVRAYEVVRATGIPIGAWRCRPQEPAPYRFATVLLMPPRDRLYAACDARFAAMIERGALDEAATLAARGLDPDLPAMKAVGLPELMRHLRGEVSVTEAVANARRATRRYAKRQMTWFRHQMAPDVILDEQFSESLLRRSRQFIDEFLLTGRE